MSTRARNVTASLDDTKNYRSQMEFRFKYRDERARTYTYTVSLHLRVLSAWVQADSLVQAGALPADQDQKIVLVDNQLRKKKYTLTPGECKTLLDKCDRTAHRMEIARTKVDEVEE